MQGSEEGLWGTGLARAGQAEASQTQGGGRPQATLLSLTQRAPHLMHMPSGGGKGAPRNSTEGREGSKGAPKRRPGAQAAPPVLTPQVTVPTGTTAWRGSRGA